MKRLSLLFIIALITSCSTKEKAKIDQFFNINFDQATPKKLVNNEISEKLGFTFLQYDEEHPVGRIITYKISKNFIVLIDSQQKVFVFKKNGELFSMIDSKGNGPSEYVSIEDFCVDPKEGFLLLLDPKNSKILKYGLDGTYIDYLKMDYVHAAHISMLPNGNYCIYQSARFSETKENIFILDADLTLVNSVFDPGSETLKDLPFLLYPNWHTFDHNTYYKEVLVDTLYKITSSNTSEPYAVVDFGTKRMPNESYQDTGLLQRNSSKFYKLGGILESQHYLFIMAMLKGERFYYIYDKLSKAPIPLELGTKALTDNFASRLDFWPTFIDNNDTMYKFIEAGDLVEKLTSFSDSDRMKKILETNDNPVLISSKLN